MTCDIYTSICFNHSGKKLPHLGVLPPSTTLSQYFVYTANDLKKTNNYKYLVNKRIINK